MSTTAYKGKKFSEGNFFSVNDILVVEESLKITINSSPFTVTMRTPGFENELVRGLLLSENIFSEIETDPIIVVKGKSEKGFINWVDITIPKEKVGKGMEISRSIVSVSSCGICGKFELEVLPDNSKKLIVEEKLNSENIGKMLEKMNSAQNIFKLTGGSHAAAAFTIDGIILALQEDIGRHNAVDKVIGSLIIKKQIQKAKCMIVSGRISYEIVNKCFAAGIPFLAAVSAPSTLAIDLSEKLGITLMAFCRDNTFTAYSNITNIK